MMDRWTDNELERTEAQKNNVLYPRLKNRTYYVTGSGIRPSVH